MMIASRGRLAGLPEKAASCESTELVAGILFWYWHLDIRLSVP